MNWAALREGYKTLAERGEIEGKGEGQGFGSGSGSGSGSGRIR